MTGSSWTDVPARAPPERRCRGRDRLRHRDGSRGRHRQVGAEVVPPGGERRVLAVVVDDEDLVDVRHRGASPGTTPTAAACRSRSRGARPCAARPARRRPSAHAGRGCVRSRASSVARPRRRRSRPRAGLEEHPGPGRPASAAHPRPRCQRAPGRRAASSPRRVDAAGDERVHGAGVLPSRREQRPARRVVGVLADEPPQASRPTWMPMRSRRPDASSCQLDSCLPVACPSSRSPGPGKLVERPAPSRPAARA